MNPGPLSVENELLQTHRCQQGDAEALARLRETHHPSLFNILRARGASAGETEELLADLWGDCVPKADDQPSLLDKFSGKCSLQAWLATVATRRWIDLKRKQARRGENQLPHENDSDDDPLAALPASSATTKDEILIDLLRDSLQAAFAACPPADLLMLRLVFLHGLSQREVMRMWAWSESKISRRLTQTMADLEKNTMAALKARDPWLELTWQDFVDLCETHEVGFL